MREHWKKGAVLAALVGVGWLYFPPLGAKIELPDIEQFLEPGIPHTKPVFIDTGRHVYYRVRLQKLVGWNFTADYLDRLPDRGVQLAPYTTSPYTPGGQRLKGWEIAMVRERTVKPYAVEYWMSHDTNTPDLPARLRWPWFYVRLGRDVRSSPHAVTLVPERDLVAVPEGFPRFPGAVAVELERTERYVSINFVAPTEKVLVLDHYAGLGEAWAGEVHTDIYGIRCALRPMDLAGIRGVTWLQVQVHRSLFSDHPVTIWSRESLLSVARSDEVQPLGTLRNLPGALRFDVSVGRPR
jgi:hypothetical protein